MDSYNRRKSFTILIAEDIKERLENDIADVMSALFVSREAATILLCNYNWDVDKVNEEWFSNKEKVRKTSGLMLENPMAVDDHIDKIKQFFVGFAWRIFLSLIMLLG
ncbi:hypothetical protein ACH5RR_021160 [Cinchona calisaya]|uniref:E3 ubiquitin-protein ligase ARIH1-like UBA-like domain-containing protein n=1 Tax=Cinchona calisaya TaxID=153742 RepID=A0ABD2ZGH3_9GENT